MSHRLPKGQVLADPEVTSSFLNGSESAYAMPLSGAWYAFAPSLTCNKSVLLKHSIPVNTSQKVLNISHVSLVLSNLSTSLLGL